jgi:serpin B
MIVLLPRDTASRTKIETQLTLATWQAVTGALEDCDVNVMLPRFSFSTQLSMTSMWQFLGVRTLFESGKADLSGMIASKGSFVKEVVHQATIEVSELGAEATAATIAEPFGAAASLAPPKRRKVSFIANRPFLWMIIHRDSGLILFLGRFAGH